MAKNEAFVDTTKQEEVEASAAPWTWVHIPEKDLLDQPFNGIGHNLLHFGPSTGNQTCSCLNYPACAKSGDHKIPTDIARDVQERLKVAQVADLRLFSGRRDMKALMALVSKGLQASAGNYEDPSKVA